MDQQRVSLELRQGIAHVRLSRPDKLNALDGKMFDSLVDMGEQLLALSDLRCVVLSGSGRSFSVGIDLNTLGQDPRFFELEKRTHGDCNLFQRAVMQWRELPVPVIAAIHGHALGGGCQLALGADIRIVAPDAKLSIREMAWGLVPDMAGIVLLRGLVPQDVARELIFSGRMFFGEEACALGLATRCAADPVRAAMDIAFQIRSSSPAAMRSAKALLNASASGHSDAALLVAEARAQQDLLGSVEHGEAVRAFHEGRSPQFG